MVEGSSGKRVHQGGTGRETGKQVASMVVGRSMKLRGYVIRSKHEAKSKLELRQGCELTKPAPRNVHPPARPHPLNFSKQHHQLGNNCSDTCAHGDISFYHMTFKALSLVKVETYGFFGKSVMSNVLLGHTGEKMFY